MSNHANQPGLDELALKRLGTGCRRTQEQVYRAHADAAWTLARRLTGCDAGAWDVVQDAFVRAFGEIGALRDPGAFRGWLRRIVAHRAMDHHRQQARRMEASGEAPERRQAPPDPAWLDLERALDRLDATDRMVLWLHDAEGMTHEEIADLAGFTRSWSKSRLVRARGRMQVLLESGAAGPSSSPAPTVESTIASN
jgi:RNA polymerase sigma-70 factor (ECF subfamily)